MDGISSKKRENILFQHFAFYVGEKDKNKWQKSWPKLGWHYLWDLDAKNSLAAYANFCILKHCRRSRVGNVI